MTRPCPTEFKKFLLYARQMEIRGVDLDAPYYNYIISFTVPDIDNVTVLDYDAREQRVYWSDVRTQAIKRAFINGTGVETVVSAGSVQACPSRGPRRPPPSPCFLPWSPAPTSCSPGSFEVPQPGFLIPIPAETRLLPLPPKLCRANHQPPPSHCAPRLAKCSWAGCGLGVPEPVLDKLRHQQEADQRGPAGRLLQECSGAGPGAAPRPGCPPPAWVSPEPGVREHGVRAGEEEDSELPLPVPLPPPGSSIGPTVTTSAWPIWTAATAPCSSVARRALWVRACPDYPEALP